MEFLYGALGAVAVIALFSLGVFAGWRLHGRYCRPKAEKPDDEALRRLKEEQEAFHQLTHYSADVAYGLRDAAYSQRDAAADPFEGSETS